jgi:hypothetical protein
MRLVKDNFWRVLWVAGVWPLLAGAGEPAAEAAASTTTAPATPALAEREAAIAAAFKRTGDPAALLTLKAADTEFIALSNPAPAAVPDSESLEGVLIVPAPMMAATDPLPAALGTSLAAGHWLTVTIQAPLEVSALEAPTKDSNAAFCARLAAGIAHLEAQKVTAVTLIGIGDALARGLACYESALPPTLIAVAGVGHWQTESTTLKLPTLDLVPSGDPVAMAAVTRHGSHESNPPYRRVVIEARDQQFQGGEVEVAKHIRGWLTQLPRTTKP